MQRRSSEVLSVAQELTDLQDAHVEGVGVLALDVGAAHAGRDLAILLHGEERGDAQVRADGVRAVRQQSAQVVHLGAAGAYCWRQTHDLRTLLRRSISDKYRRGNDVILVPKRSHGLIIHRTHAETSWDVH